MRALIFVFILFLASSAAPRAEAFRERGYYMTFMRMPLWGLPEWKAAIDCMEEDRANVLLLWTAGAFKSKKFPITWNYNREHKNIEADFAHELIDYAHAKKIRVVLGFTPFGYDGANQYSIEHPELKARKANGEPVDTFGIHCWGWSLCPARPESQTFMLEYIREMAFEFYPNADGLLIESSDYDVCRCKDCGSNFYKNEFGFVRKISDEMWARNPKATVVVFPHYFSGKKVNAGSAIETTAASFELDKRWTLVFTPHSSHLDPDLIARAGSSYYWTDAPSLGTPSGIREGALKGLEFKISGFVPSLEPFSYKLPAREGPEGKRVKQLGLDWIADDAMAFTNLPVRLQRFAFREYSENPKLTEADFKKRAARQFFNDENSPHIDDLFFLQQCVNTDRNWAHSSPMVDPTLPKAKTADYSAQLARLRRMATNSAPEISSIAKYIVGRWAK